MLPCHPTTTPFPFSTIDGWHLQCNQEGYLTAMQPGCRTAARICTRSACSMYTHTHLYTHTNTHLLCCQVPCRTIVPCPARQQEACSSGCGRAVHRGGSASTAMRPCSVADHTVCPVQLGGDWLLGVASRRGWLHCSGDQTVAGPVQAAGARRAPVGCSGRMQLGRVRALNCRTVHGTHQHGSAGVSTAVTALDLPGHVAASPVGQHNRAITQTQTCLLCHQH